MRILFLTPPRTDILNRDFAATQNVPPLGIASMIGNLKDEFPKTSVLDAYAEGLSLKQTLKRIRDFKPDILAVSSITIQIHDASIVAGEVKKLKEDIAIIVGGPHASKIPQETLNEFPIFDYVAAGEGEYLMKEFAAALQGGESTDSINGLYMKNNGRMITGGERPFIEELDNLKFPEWKDFAWHAYSATYTKRRKRIREIPVSVNRGCPYHCIFCARFMGSKVRKRDIGRVIAEIEYDIGKYGAQQILFTDETFTVERKGVLDLCEAMVHRGLEKKVKWVCVTRPDLVDDGLIEIMSKAGCSILCFGADGLSDESLEYMNKKHSISHIKEAVSLCRKYGIESQAAYIIGLPGDTEPAIRKNIKRALIVDSDFATFSIMVPYPGTKIMEKALKKEDNWVLLSKDWRNFGKQLGFAMETKNMNRLQLERCQRAAYLRFYLRPGKILNIFRIVKIHGVVIYWISHLLKMSPFRTGERRA